MSGGGGGGGNAAAEEAAREAERVQETLRAREQLVERLEAQVAVQQSLNSWDKIEKELALETLEVNQKYDNFLKNETNELIIQNTERARALELEMKLSDAQSDRLSQAQNEFTEFYNKEKEANAELTKTEELLKGAYETVTNGLTSGIEGLINGTKEWGDVLGDIAKQLGSMLLNAGFKALGGGLGIPGLGPKAAGGGVSGNTPYLVGENGPEMFVPQAAGRVVNNNDSKMALDRYSYQDNGPAKPSQPIKIDYTSTTVAGQEYVTTAQFQQGIAAAAKEGAKSGESRVMSSLRNSRSRRKSLGF